MGSQELVRKAEIAAALFGHCISKSGGGDEDEEDEKKAELAWTHLRFVLDIKESQL